MYDVDPSGGSHSGGFLDGKNVRQLQPAWIRRQLGVAAQEPNLFDLTIRGNIDYGDLSREVPTEEIIAAAKAANIHAFVESLPEVRNIRR